jgi:hypothetical protein
MSVIGTTRLSKWCIGPNDIPGKKMPTNILSDWQAKRTVTTAGGVDNASLSGTSSGLLSRQHTVALVRLVPGITTITVPHLRMLKPGA